MLWLRFIPVTCSIMLAIIEGTFSLRSSDANASEFIESLGRDVFGTGYACHSISLLKGYLSNIYYFRGNGYMKRCLIYLIERLMVATV